MTNQPVSRAQTPVSEGRDGERRTRAQIPVREHRTHDRLPRAVSEAGHPHGRPVSWVLVAVVLAAFVLGGISIILNAWWLLAVCGGVVLLAVPVGAVIHIMDDTVGWAVPPPTRFYPGHIIHEASKVYDEEHPRPTAGRRGPGG